MAHPAEGEAMHVRHVRIEGNRRTRPHVVERELQAAYRGKTLGEIVLGLEVGIERLKQLKIFDEVHILMDKHSGDDAPGAVDLIVQLEESSLFHGSLMMESGSDAVGEASGTLTSRNLFGGAENMSVRVGQTSDQSSRFHFDLGWPRISAAVDGTSNVFASKSNAFHGLASGYDEHVRATGVTLSSPNGKLRGGYSMDVRDVVPTTIAASSSMWATAKAVAHDCRPSTKSSVFLQWRHDSRNHPFLPTVGALSNIKVEVAGLGGDVHFHKVQATLTKAIPVLRTEATLQGDGPVLSWGLFAGLVKPTGASARAAQEQGGSGVRINDRFFLQSPLMLRGFDNRGIGPRTTPLTDTAHVAPGGKGTLYSMPKLLAGATSPQKNATEVANADTAVPPRTIEAPTHGFALGGEAQVLASARLEFPLPLPLFSQLGVRGSIFGNAGNTLPLQEATGGKFLDNCRKSMRASAGVGFVIGFPIGRLEINYIGWARRFAGDQGGDVRRWKWGISSEFL